MPIIKITRMLADFLILKVYSDMKLIVWQNYLEGQFLYSSLSLLKNGLNFVRKFWYIFLSVQISIENFVSIKFLCIFFPICSFFLQIVSEFFVEFVLPWCGPKWHKYGIFILLRNRNFWRWKWPKMCVFDQNTWQI